MVWARGGPFNGWRRALPMMKGVGRACYRSERWMDRPARSLLLKGASAALPMFLAVPCPYR